MMGARWLSTLAAVATLLVAASGRSTRFRQARDARCAVHENFVRLASDESCVKYYQCYSGNAYLMQCPDHTWFNENEQICDDSPPPHGCELAPPYPQYPEESEDPDSSEEVTPAPEESAEIDGEPEDGGHVEGPVDSGAGGGESSSEHESAEPEDGGHVEGPVDSGAGGGESSSEHESAEPEDGGHVEDPVDSGEGGGESADENLNSEELNPEFEEQILDDLEGSLHEEPNGGFEEGSGDPNIGEFGGEENNGLPGTGLEESGSVNIEEGSGIEGKQMHLIERQGDDSSKIKPHIYFARLDAYQEIAKSQELALDEVFEVGDESLVMSSVEAASVVHNLAGM